MKEKRKIILLFASVLFSLGGAVTPCPASESSSPQTPEEVARFLRQNISLEEDSRLFGQAEYWQSPQELLTRRKGDCEDYALLAQSLLQRLGRDAFVLSLYGRGGYAHTVCVYVEEGQLHVLNVDRVLRTRAKSLEELVGLLYADWTWGAIVRPEGSHGRILREIFKR